MVLGQRYHPPRPNLDYWRMERFVLPEAIVGDHCIRHDIRTILECAEATGTALESACSTYAEDVLRHGNRQIEQKDVHNFVAQLPCIPHYWSTLESRFHEVLRDYTLEKDPDDIHRQWLVAVRGALSSAWDLHRASIDGADAWAIRAFVKADGIIGRKITELNRDIQALKEEP